MAIVFVKAVNNAASKTAVTSLSIAIPAGGCAAGHRLILSFSLDANNAPTVSDSQTNSWAQDSHQSATLSAANVFTWSANLTTALTVTDTISVSWGSAAIYAYSVSEWSGIAASSYTRGTQSSGQATSATPSVTTAAAQSGTPVSGDLVIGAIATNGPSGDTFTQDTDTLNGSWNSNLTRVGTAGGSQTSNYTVAGGDKIVTAGGDQTWNPAITSRAWAETLVVYIPAAVAIPHGPRPIALSQAVNRSTNF